MPKTLTLQADHAYSGVDVTYTKRTQTVSVFGWYGNTGMEPQEMPLGAFLRGLGITERDVRKALAAPQPPEGAGADQEPAGGQG